MTHGILLAKLKAKYWLSAVRARLIGEFAPAVLTEGFNGKLLVPTKDLSVGRHLCFSGEYNRHHIEGLLRLIKPDSRILCVGAHIGALLIPLARNGAQAVAIEPDPFSFELLAVNVAMNGLAGKIRCHRVAASDRRGEARFLSGRVNSGGNKVIDNGDRGPREFYFDNPAEIAVPSERLDHLLAAAEDFDVIVIDVEGSEARVLRGMQRILRAARWLSLEILPNHIEKLGGVTATDFLAQLPDTFSYAYRLASKSPGREYSRPEWPAVCEEIWATAYYGGEDILFGQGTLPE